MQYEILVITAFFTSAFTAMAGIGGGLILVGLMSGMIPAQALVPVHGVVQLFSNSSRAVFTLKEVQWRFVKPFIIGGLLGAALGSTVLRRLPLEWFPLILGSFILVLVWLPIGGLVAKIPGKYISVGCIQSFLSLFVGAAGPLSSSILYKESMNRDEYVATSAALMSIMHALKIAAFVVIGFAFAPYWKLLVLMIAASVLGSWIGTRFRGLIPEKVFRSVLRILLTVIALRILYNGVLSVMV